MVTQCYTFTTMLPNCLDANEVIGLLPRSSVAYVQISGNSTVVIRKLTNIGVLYISWLRGYADVGMNGARLYDGIWLASGSCVVLRNGVHSTFTLTQFLLNSQIEGSTLRLINCSFANVAYEEVIANHTVYIARRPNQTVNFGGEVMPRTDMVAYASGNSPAYISIPTRKRYVGFGLASAPSGSLVGLVGKQAVSASTTGVWLFTEASEGMVSLVVHGSAPQGSTWVLANYTEWDDGELPCYAKQVADETSGNIWRIIALPTASGAPLSFALPSTKMLFKAFRARNSTTKSIKVYESGVLVAQIDVSTEFGWYGYNSLAERTTFVVDGVGNFDLDVDSWGRNYYPNYARVLGLAGALPAVTKVSPNFSALPTEHYIVHLNGALTEMVSTHTKLLYLARTLSAEGITISQRLDETFSLTYIVYRAAQELIGALSVARAYTDTENNVCYINIFCATKEEEAVLVARVAALLRSFAELLKALYPQGETPPALQIKVIHREA